MRVSFVLRLDPAALADGGFAGEVEAVASGSLAALRSVDDLVAFCARHADGHVDGQGAHAVITSLDLPVGGDGRRRQAARGDQEGRKR